MYSPFCVERVVERVVYYRFIISLLLLIILMQSEDNLSYILPQLRNYLDHVADVRTSVLPHRGGSELSLRAYRLQPALLIYIRPFHLLCKLCLVLSQPA